MLVVENHLHPKRDMSSMFQGNPNHQMGSFPFLPNLTFNPLTYLQNLTTETLIPSSSPKQDIISSDFGGPQLRSLKRSSQNLWALEEVKMKKMKLRRKVRDPRFCFKTMSDVDVLDDGYKWRKYGQKVVKNTQYPRSYYRCTQDNCRVKKRVERLAEDPRMVITTYEGRHVHSPSPDHDQNSHSPSHLNNFFLL